MSSSGTLARARSALTNLCTLSSMHSRCSSTYMYVLRETLIRTYLPHILKMCGHRRPRAELIKLRVGQVRVQAPASELRTCYNLDIHVAIPAYLNRSWPGRGPRLAEYGHDEQESWSTYIIRRLSP
ncbi:hypothetical protein P167DRAFT_418218 [Morchella conica CCBAS932]|uniref:Uncharacterized protein n=1 Tax=Morchella conica CCBAS932 TaxID=1392247 RepID=A0A3N4KA04_9PEZI|nr:hypothetical protein P167DRAFT_418218 [Morchella conica CCBAS932]